MANNIIGSHTAKSLIVFYEEQQKVDEIFLILTELFESRFIEKICRPIQKDAKEALIVMFKSKLRSLHSKMNIIKEQAIQEKKLIEKLKKKCGKKFRIKGYQETIKDISLKYDQVLKEGSFKHFNRIMQLQKLPHKIQLLDSYEWMMMIIFPQKKQNKCCLTKKKLLF